MLVVIVFDILRFQDRVALAFSASLTFFLLSYCRPRLVPVFSVPGVPRVTSSLV